MLKCSECNNEFRTIEFILDHLRKEHAKSTKDKTPFLCGNCQTSCTYDSMRKHLRNKHKKDEESHESVDISDESKEENILETKEHVKKMSFPIDFQLELCEIPEIFEVEEESENYLIADVPADNSCLFWAAAFAFLIPVADVMFQDRFKILFNNSPNKDKWLEKINLLLKGEDCSLDEDMHNDIMIFRYNVVKHIEINKAFFQEFIEENFDDYLKKMKSPSRWGGEPEVKATSKMLPCNLYVYKDHKHLNKYLTDADNPTMILFHTEDNHYKFGLSKHILKRKFDTYKTTGLRNSLHGNIYQLKLLVLFLKRGFEHHQNFCLATEILAGEKFDDLLYIHLDERGNKAKDADGKIHIQFLQAKHAHISRKITYSELTKNSGDDDFSLAKYYKSYKDIKKNQKFHGFQLEKFYISTNIKMDLTTTETPSLFYIEDKTKPKQPNASFPNLNEKESANASQNQQLSSQPAKIYVKLLQNDDVFFNTEKLKGTVDRYKLVIDDNMRNYLKSKTTMEILAIQIVKYFTGEKKNLNHGDKIFKPFESVLFTENILEVIERKTDVKEKDYSVKLTKVFAKVIEGPMNQHLSPDGEKFKGYFSNEYAKRKQITIEQIDWNELAKITIDTSRPVGKKWINFEVQHDNPHLAGVENNEETDEKKEEKGKNVDEKEFYLPLTEEEEKKEVEEFLENLVFAITPDEEELGKIISNELGEQFHLMDSDFVTSQTLVSVLDWMKEHYGRYFHDYQVKKLFTQIDEKIAKMIMAGVSLEYCRVLKSQNMVSKSSVKDIIVSFLNSKEQQILHVHISSTKEVQDILASMYKKIDSYIIIPIETAMSMKKEVLLLANAKKSNNIFVFVDEGHAEIDNVVIEFCNKIAYIARKIKNKKFIFITDRRHLFEQNLIEKEENISMLPIKDEKMDTEEY